MVKRLLFLLSIILALYVARESYFYVLVREKLPAGTTIGAVDVAELTLQEAGERVAAAYAEPIVLFNDEVGEEVPVSPAELGFSLDLETMLASAEEEQLAQDWWLGFIGYLVKSPLEAIEVELVAAHDVDKVYEVAQIVTQLVADPAQPPRVDPETLRFLEGEDGFSADIDTTADRAIDALYSTENRRVKIPLIYETAPPLDLDLVAQTLTDMLEGQRSLLGSVFIMDLQTGKEISINGDLALSGMSIVKIPILLETYRRAVSDIPNFDQQKLINETAVNSGNYSANILLDYVAGQNNAYLGVDILTESMERLGLQNTFIVTPYEEPPRPERLTKFTPANTVAELQTDPDPNMQTTAEDMGTLLAMIYDCSKGGGALLALYPTELSAVECQAILDVLALNVEGNLIRFGVPDGVMVAHKHGWATNTHGDAGIVFTPGGDYVIVTYLTEPGSDWLVADNSFPILREMSRIVYNYFNADDPYLEERIIEELVEEEADADASDTFDLEENALETVPETGE